MLGKGSFGKVYLVKQKTNDCLYAMKTIRKDELISRNMLENILCTNTVYLLIAIIYIIISRKRYFKRK